MNARSDSEPDTTKNRTTVEAKSEREIVVTRTFDAPARIVFQAWTTPALFKRWWVPKSMPLALLSYEADIRTSEAATVSCSTSTARRRWRSSASTSK